MAEAPAGEGTMKAVLAALAIVGASAAWASQPAPKPAAKSVPAGLGKQVYDKWCAACHASGPRYPGTASLAAKYGKDMPAPLEQRSDLTPELVAYFVRQGVSIMPPFRKTEITDAQLAALGAYLSREPAK
jgi:(+)-pinoresinol hydroxylase